MIALPMAPAEQAERLTGRQYLSFSSIALYQACPLKWYFKYVVGLTEDIVSASLVFGSAIHASLQRHFEGLLIDGEPPVLDDLMAAYEREWSSRSEVGVGISLSKGDTFSSLNDMAARMLRAFQISDLASPAGSIVAIEEELSGEVVPGCPPMLARIDLATETEDVVVVTDFKTSRNRWSVDQADDASTQLLLYHDLARSFAGGKRIQLQFGVLTKAKEPAVEIYPIEQDQKRTARTRRIVERVWNAIHAEQFYPAPSPMNCPTCPYRGPCRTWEG